MVAMPDINIHEEMVDMIASSRTYEANLAVVKNARDHGHAGAVHRQTLISRRPLMDALSALKLVMTGPQAESRLPMPPRKRRHPPAKSIPAAELQQLDSRQLGRSAALRRAQLRPAAAPISQSMLGDFVSDVAPRSRPRPATR